MKTYIYLHHSNCICAIVCSQYGHKFIDNVERFCTDFQFLIDEAKSGFSGYPFFEEKTNDDFCFWDLYDEIYCGGDENYKLVLSACDGEIVVDSKLLDNSGEYFESLHTIMRIAEAYDFVSLKDVVYTKDYVVICSKRDLLICSNIKVPFEPDMEQKKLRDLIRFFLADMDSFEDDAMYAKYGSIEAIMCDIENVLFYNIGSAYFKNVITAKTSVFFERIHMNSTYSEKNVSFKYIYHYTLCPKISRKWWLGNKCICKWSNVPLAKINYNDKPHKYYSAIKNNMDLIECFADGSEVSLGMNIVLCVPKSAKFSNVVDIIKPLIDGTLCAFHVPFNINADRVSELLSKDKEMLLSTEKTCLGKCCYVRPFRKSVKWNPQDDRLDYVYIEPKAVEDEEFSFSGEIYIASSSM